MLIRFRNRKTGSAVRVDGVTAERLSRREWERLSAAPTPPPAPEPAPEPADAPVEAGHEAPAPVVESAPGAPAGNASRGEWATYAASLGFEVDGLKRDEIRDLLASGTTKGAA